MDILVLVVVAREYRHVRLEVNRVVMLLHHQNQHPQEEELVQNLPVQWLLLQDQNNQISTQNNQISLQNNLINLQNGLLHLQLWKCANRKINHVKQEEIRAINSRNTEEKRHLQTQIEDLNRQVAVAKGDFDKEKKEKEKRDMLKAVVAQTVQQMPRHEDYIAQHCKAAPVAAPR